MTRNYLDIEDDLEFKNNKYNEISNSGNRVEVEDHVGSTKFKTSPTSDLSVAAAEELVDHLKVDVNIR